MNVKLIGKDYSIEDEGTIRGKRLSIRVGITEKGKVSILNNQSEHDFRFIGSEPEMVVKIGKMIVQAGLLGLEEKKKIARRMTEDIVIEAFLKGFGRVSE